MTVFAGSIANPVWDAEFTAVGRVYHVAPGGTDGNDGSAAAPFATIQHAANLVNPGDKVVVHEGLYVEDVRVTRSGAPGAYVIFQAEGNVQVRHRARSGDYWGPTQHWNADPTDKRWNTYWYGVVTLEGASYVVVSGFTFEEHPCFGIAAHAAHDLFIQNNTTDHTGSSGIYVGSAQNVTVRGNTVRRGCDGGLHEMISLAGVDDFSVHDNEVFGSGTNGEGYGGEGIDVKVGSKRGRVYGNYVHSLWRLGIYVDAWDEDLSDVEVFSNHVWDCATGIAVSSESGGDVRRVRVHDNVVWENGMAGIVISPWGTDGWREDVAIVNNTVVRNGASVPWGGIFVSTTHVRGVVIRNNLVSQNTGPQISARSSAEIVADHNLVDGFRDAQGEILGTDVIQGDPQLAPSTGELLDDTLLVGSPAIDAGSPDGAPDVDSHGTARPQGAAVDIGSYEAPGVASRARP